MDHDSDESSPRKSGVGTSRSGGGYVAVCEDQWTPRRIELPGGRRAVHICSRSASRQTVSQSISQSVSQSALLTYAFSQLALLTYAFSQLALLTYAFSQSALLTYALSQSALLTYAFVYILIHFLNTLLSILCMD